jgi:hypothetical protein
MIRRYAVCAAAGAALALSLAACGGGDGGKKAQAGASTSGKTGLAAEQVLGTASQKAGAIKSFKATISSDTIASGQHVKMTGRLSYRLSPEPAMRMIVSGMSVNGKESGGFEEILLGDSVYMKMPALSQQTGGKPWIKMSLSKIGAQSGIDIKSLLNQSKQADPSANVRMLAASKDLNKVGSEAVGGAQTTHYKGSYSVQDALAKLSGDQRAAMQQMIAKSGLKTMDFDVWLDDQQLPRKMTVKTPAGSQVQTTNTMTYSGFNQPVSISAPPAGQVTSAG